MAKLDRHQGREPIKSFNTMSKRKPDDEPADAKRGKVISEIAPLRAVPAADATTGACCARLANDVLMPWVGFGTYRLKEGEARAATLMALHAGYRHIDTAYVYGGEKTEAQVGAALRSAFAGSSARAPLARSDVFVTTKQWRKFHGYAETRKCLATSLRRLGLEAVDLYLIHWPGAAWSTMARKKELTDADPFHYALDGHDAAALPALRAETWRAMEDALAEARARARARARDRARDRSLVSRARVSRARRCSRRARRARSACRTSRSRISRRCAARRACGRPR